MMTMDGDDGHSPWHSGERSAQTRAGVADLADGLGRRAIRSFLTEQQRAFFAALPMLVLGSVGRDDWPWASVLAGPPGFAASPTPDRLDIAARPPADDPAVPLEPGAPLALLGIDFASRRRNRVNGRVAAVEAAGFSLAVEQSFGNCPKYIQPRALEPMFGRRRNRINGRVEPFEDLGGEVPALIARSDTAFVATFAGREQAGENGGVDVSHRGGPPGFVTVDARGFIQMPDYTGNRYFNTLGNLMVNPRAGLLFLDFLTGDALQIAGSTEIVWDGPEVAALPGAERLWRLRPSHGRWLRGW